ncbi:MAG TPA: helix-turn-helix domain-containing protein [Mycobacteriales bacterium]|jgi:transcriptional regulator with XRE-family HTH domain|nr:helix-turn-helix domain-containing protein [Mycobacteriales bacterium]
MDADLAGRLHDADLTTLGKRIRDRRLACGLTQEALAAGAVTVGYISRIESGQRRPDVKLLEAFAGLLDTTPEYLVLGVSPARSDEVLLTLLHAELAVETGDAEVALREVELLLGDGSEPVGPTALRRGQLLQARALEALGRYDEAIVMLERLAEQESGGAALAVRVALSRCYRESGDLARAVDVGESALRALKAAGIDGGEEAIRLAVTVAAAHFERGDAGHAVRIAMTAIERAEESGAPNAMAAAYWNASVFEAQRGHTTEAVPLAERALALLASGEDRRNLARLRAEVGVMQLSLDPPDLSAAQGNLERARADLTTSSASVADMAHCDVALARVRLAAGEDAAATELAEAALDATRDAAPLAAAGAASVLGQIAARAGDAAAARDHYRTAVGLLTGVGQDRAAAQLWLDLGAQLESVGDAAGALDAYRRAAVATGLQLPAALQLSR